MPGAVLQQSRLAEKAFPPPPEPPPPKHMISTLDVVTGKMPQVSAPVVSSGFPVSAARSSFRRLVLIE